MSYTLKEVVDKARGRYKEKFWIYFGNLLIDFKQESADNEYRYNLVKDEPDFEGYEDWQKAFIAGSANKLCDDYGIENPSWVFKKEYFLDEPYFSLNTESELKLILLVESPIQFRMRQVFVSSNTLDIA